MVKEGVETYLPGQGRWAIKKAHGLELVTSIARDDDVMTENEIEHELVAEAENAWAQSKWSIQHVLFPSMRLFFKPPNSMATNGTFVRVASLEKLYRIFERC
ncbi:hypothetical protein ACFX1S_043839 [Malus domestica]